MENTIAVLFHLFVGCILCFCGLHFLFKRKYAIQIMIAIEVACIVLTLLTVFFLYPYIYICLLFASLFLVTWILIGFNGTWHAKLVIGILYVLSLVFSVFFTDQSLIFHVSSNPSELSLPHLLFICLILLFTDFIAIAISTVITSVAVINKGDRSTWLTLFLYLFFPLSQFFLIDRTLISSYSSNDYTPVVFLAVAVIFSIIADIALIAACQSVRKNSLLRVRYAALTQQLEFQTIYYQQVTDFYARLRHLRHDLNNHLYTLQILLQDEKREDVLAYLNNLNIMNLASSNNHYCDHPVADMFLSQTDASLSRSGIKIESKLSIPTDVGIENADLICALGSLLKLVSNICPEYGSSVIHISSNCNLSMLQIHVFISNKDRSQLTGLVQVDESSEGMLNHLVKRYNGSFSKEITSDTFSISLQLNRGLSYES